MRIHGWLSSVLHTTLLLVYFRFFLFSELPLLQVVAIVIACLVSAAILGLLCLFLCKYHYYTVEKFWCCTRSTHVVYFFLGIWTIKNFTQRMSLKIQFLLTVSRLKYRINTFFSA